MDSSKTLKNKLLSPRYFVIATDNGPKHHRRDEEVDLNEGWASREEEEEGPEELASMPFDVCFRKSR